jgi:glyoxylase-like metal-dependent hydrolase (beta-lactamase superfamily II)
MNYEYAMRADNVYVIDTRMFGFEHYMSAFLVEGKELALIDTGLPDQLETVRAGIKKHGFSVHDLSYIFATHEHQDHTGNVAPLLRENPKIQFFIHPLGGPFVMDPSLEDANRKQNLPPHMAARFAKMEPVPRERMHYLNNGDVFDLGHGEKLRVHFAPGHQPSGVVLYAEKNRGLFIHDLVGNCFADCDFQLILNPPRSDLKQAMKSLRMFQDTPALRLFMGHFGISDKPKHVIERALESMQELMDIGAKCVAEGKPEEMISRVYAYKMLEVEKLKARGKTLYDYQGKELAASQAKLFAEYYLGTQHQKG